MACARFPSVVGGACAVTTNKSVTKGRIAHAKSNRRGHVRLGIAGALAGCAVLTGAFASVAGDIADTAIVQTVAQLLARAQAVLMGWNVTAAIHSPACRPATARRLRYAGTLVNPDASRRDHPAQHPVRCAGACRVVHCHPDRRAPAGEPLCRQARRDAGMQHRLQPRATRAARSAPLTAIHRRPAALRR